MMFFCGNSRLDQDDKPVRSLDAAWNTWAPGRVPQPTHKRGVFGLSPSLTHTLSHEAGRTCCCLEMTWQRMDFCFNGPCPVG